MPQPGNCHSLEEAERILTAKRNPIFSGSKGVETNSNKDQDINVNLDNLVVVSWTDHVGQIIWDTILLGDSSSTTPQLNHKPKSDPVFDPRFQ